MIPTTNKETSSSSIDEILDMLRAGQWVSAAAADSPEVSDMLTRCADACFDINNMRPSRKEERRQAFQNLLGKFGKDSVIHSPFRCDFGFNIRIGDHVMIGPNCSLITITHALQENQRQEGLMAARPIKIGNHAWIAANIVILPGVEIGEGAVIGAGSVVTKSIPPRMLAVGNPCRPIRPITDEDRICLK